MAEPHELEERAHALMAEYFSKKDGLRLGVRAILAMVRQEQEKWFEQKMATTANLSAADECALSLIGVRAWWLSHTAPQEK